MTVVAGHKKTGAPDSPSTIHDTKRYLQDFDRLQKTAKSDHELASLAADFANPASRLFAHSMRVSLSSLITGDYIPRET
jgi:hypothetical protein